ncbi:MAG: alpha/beta fold hydrolase [Acidimicrobiia bacterium]|nr:alpha/beta fold hydrolase [Acidimicrobiia bacterium]MDH5238191.1 alpha/beta fold hydrolase [Acidimicrobiia bacterium]
MSDRDVMTGSIVVRGAELAYEWGGVGPDVVWGHGLTSSMAGEQAAGLVSWPRVREANRVLRYDARGHGSSASTSDRHGYAWSALAQDQLAMADALGIESYVAGGASMGCATALHAAVQAPQRVRALVLLIPPTGWESRAGQAELYESMAAIVERDGVEPLIAASAQLPPADPFVGLADLAEQQADALRAWDAGRLAQVFRGATTAQLPDREQIARLTQPTLVLAWTGDATHPVATADELGGLLPHAEVEVVSDLGAVLAWSQRVQAFLADVG